jgi:two-component system cell cycle sensor histidine kinase PleC
VWENFALRTRTFISESGHGQKITSVLSFTRSAARSEDRFGQIERQRWTESNPFDNLSGLVLQKALFMAAKNAAKSRRSASKSAPRSGASARTQAEMNENEARFVLDEDGKVLYASKAFCTLVNINTAKIKNQILAEIMDFADPDDALRVQSLFGRGSGKYIDTVNEGTHEILLHGQAEPVRTMFRFDKVALNDGRRFMIAAECGKDDNAAPRDSETITQTHLQSTLTRILGNDAVPAKATAKPDVTIDKAVKSDDLQHFLNMSNDVFAVSTHDGYFARVNSTFADMLGYDEASLRDMTFLDLVCDEDRASVRRTIQSLMQDDTADGYIIDFEARVIAKDGCRHWIEWRQKRSGGMIYSVGHDITALKEQEVALKEQEQMLSEAQSIGRMGHWRWPIGNDNITWSNEIYRIFGVKRDQFTPSLETLTALVHKRDISRVMQAFQRAIIEQKNYEMEFRVVHPDGQTRYIRCEGKCEQDEDGDVTALFGIMQDITERTLHERDLHEAKDAAERAYAAKSQFLANMSHELRTPLNAIIGFSEMMQRQLLGPIGTPKYLDYIAGIRESGEHLLDLISDILDMSKIEAGKYELDLEELNVAKIIPLAIHMMEGRAQEGRIRITSEISKENMQIVADRRAVMQVLLNLLSNAVKFTKPGGSVKVECLPREEYVCIRVSDTGIGIPANKIHVVTRPFEQAAASYTRDHEGTGLGLSITKDLIELHGGNMHIESTVGVGTTVTIRLPYSAYDHIKKQKTKTSAGS